MEPQTLDRRGESRTRPTLLRRLLHSLAATALVVQSSLGAQESTTRTDSGLAASAQAQAVVGINGFSEDLQAWDDFLITLIKQTVANLPVDQTTRVELMDIVLDARYEAVNVIESNVRDWPAAFRGLFIQTWDRLTPILERYGDKSESVSPFQFMLSATEMLENMEQMARNFGIDLSEVMRRLVVMYQVDGKPAVQAHGGVDPELRTMFGFGPPLPPPGVRQLPEPVDQRDKRSGVFIKRAWAASGRPGLSRLRGWAPTRGDIHEYLPLARDLLRDTAQRQLQQSQLSREFHALYRDLLLAVAWQETCWRQFVKVDGGIKPIRSARGAVGLMQVVPAVWRGFYDVNGLTFDIFYNARAGGEILFYYLNKHAIAKQEHRVTGNVDDLARAAYAAYNGGPGHLRRYRQKSTPSGLRAIDQAFYRKYRLTKKGEELAVAQCYAE